MAVSIRLMRFGKKKQPFYRIVAVDSAKKRDGRYIEKLGYYNPMTNPSSLKINPVRLKDWLNKGAILSEGMRKLYKKRIKPLLKEG